MTRAWIEVDLGALCRNASAIASRAGVPLLPMVKADAYGLGALRAALALESLDPWGYGVATVSEGDELRRGGITRPIIVFTPILRTEIDALRRADLTPALGDPAVIESWARTGRPWHLQIDTGMGRAGMRWDDVEEHRQLLVRARPSGVFTHFHSAELEGREPRRAGAAVRARARGTPGAPRARACREWPGGGAARAVALFVVPTGYLPVRCPRLRWRSPHS
jgi:Alanine racemase